MNLIPRKHFSLVNWFSHECECVCVDHQQSEVDNNRNGKPSTLFEKWFSLFTLGVEWDITDHMAEAHYRMVYWLRWMCSFQQSNRNITVNNILFYLDAQSAQPFFPTSLLFKNQPPHSSGFFFVSVCFYNLLIFIVQHYCKLGSVHMFWAHARKHYSVRPYIFNFEEAISYCILFALASIYIEFIIYTHIVCGQRRMIIC